jgi:cyclophilin family peptidyl-prolyl cis-trans isomerase
VFHAPPPLPEEIAAKEQELADRRAAVRGGSPGDPGGEAEGEEEADEELTFKPGEAAPAGMSAAQLMAFRKAQGDPVEGTFTFEMAIEGLEGWTDRAELWVLFRTTRGVIDCHLLSDAAPLTVANFVGLARGLRPFREPGAAPGTPWVKRRYLDGTLFHRVIPGFMIQAGDPTGTGLGNPGYVIEDEFSPEHIHDRPGVMSMANRSQANTGGSQFFITLNPTPHLDGVHTVFGVCSDEGVRIADDISLVPRGQGDKPDEEEKIERVDFEWRPPADS